MNKTVTINLSGIVFHIDENAYDTLKKYLESIRSKFTAADGRDEIVADIESRIAEMFQQRISDSKQAILPEDVSAVINTLGKPEDISETAGATPVEETDVPGERAYALKKRFFRNPDDKILGGVCGGISAYFDFDPIYLRLAFALCFFFAGTGILLYIILWIIVPIAKTPSEKLQMRGEDVTLSAIQKSVRDELDDVKNRAGEVITKARAKNAGEHVVNFIKEVVVAFAKFFVKVVSVVAIFVSLIILFVLSVLLLSVFGLFGLAMHNHVFMMMAPRADIFIGLIGLMLLLGVPAVMLLLAGIKKLFKINWNLKKAGAIFAGLMLVGFGTCLVIVFSVGKYYSNAATVNHVTAWQLPVDKAFHIKLNATNLHITTIETHDGFYIDGDSDDSVLRGHVSLRIEQSSNDSVQVITAASSRGLNKTDAYYLARKVQYNYTNNDSVLMLDPYCSLGQNDAWRNQRVRVIVRIPVNTELRIDKNFDKDDLNFEITSPDNDLSDDDFYGHTFTMTNDGLKCNDCNDMPDEDNGATYKHQEQEFKHHKRNTKHQTDSLKLKTGNTSTKPVDRFTDYLDENVNANEPISYPIAVVKQTVNQYSDSFVAYLKNTVHVDEVINHVGDIYTAGQSYASAFNDYLKNTISPDNSINYPTGNTQMADNLNNDFVNYLKYNVSADEAANLSYTEKAKGKANVYMASSITGTGKMMR